MFDRIARRYDLLNRLASFGQDHRWRAVMVGRLPLGDRDAKVLDLATGTADVALEIARRHPRATVVALDPSRGMLALGEQKVRRAGLSSRVELFEGDAQHLPFADRSFDACTMAFGIRNVPDRPAALREIRRVLVPGSVASFLELSEPRGVVAPLARWHVHQVVPRLGALLSGADEYRYLERSIRAFPPPNDFLRLLADAGLSGHVARRFSFGACLLFEATAT